VRLNLGCGRNPLDGYVNLDLADLPGVDVVHDLDSPDDLPFAADTFTEIAGVDLIEHVQDPLHVMSKLWRVATNGAVCQFALPYGSSDDAWEDPTHRRPYFVGSWGYFSQPHYWRADYGYRADWELVGIDLLLYDYDGDVEAAQAQVMTLRNVVARQHVTLRAVKPARPCDRTLIAAPHVTFRLYEGR